MNKMAADAAAPAMPVSISTPIAARPVDAAARGVRFDELRTPAALTAQRMQKISLVTR